MTERPVALVTGAARGIGRAIAMRLASDGFDVAIHYRTSRVEAENVATQARAIGASAIAVQGDLTVAASAFDVVDRVHASLGRLDVAVNNVGNYHKGPLEDLTPDTWRDMMASNLDATFFICQRAVPLLRDSPRGRIVNIGYAGSDALVAKPGIAAYQIAKTGVFLYSRALARTEAAYGTTVNVVAPGVIENSVTQPLDEIPMGHVGTLGDMASTVSFLVSLDAGYVTGAFVPVSGGWNV